MEGQRVGGSLEASLGAGAESISGIVRIGAALLRGFIRSLLEGAPGPPRPVLPAELGDAEPADAPDGTPLASLREAALRVWARLSRDPEMDSLVGALAGRPALPALAEVSEQLFQSGINWGRIVVFFYFTYRVVLQALQGSDPLRTVIDWAVSFLERRLAAWVQRQGGWISMLSYSPPEQM